MEIVATPSRYNNDDILKNYFLALLDMKKSGVQYPANIDHLWRFVYKEKGKAVRALLKDFIEGVDFEVIAQNGKNPSGGRPEIEYNLSLSCLEYFIARKVRRVFDVYREVFHQATEQIPAPAVINSLDYLQLMLDGMKAQESRILTVEKEVKELVAQTKTRPDYYTIVGYASLHSIKIGLKFASELGRKASAICKMRNYRTETLPDPRFGTVKTYPYDVLEEVFNLDII